MTLPVSAVSDTTCSQLFMRRHYEFTFSNDTVTALDLDLWRDPEGDRQPREDDVAPAR
jgi:hypothetical protein